MSSHIKKLAPSMSYMDGELPLSVRINALGDISEIFNHHVGNFFPYDFSVIGKAYLSGNSIEVSDVFLQQGELHNTHTRLITDCNSLLSIWRVMRQVCLLDLGPCGCIGSLRNSNTDINKRSFMVHGHGTDEFHVIFIILSTHQRSCNNTDKQFLHDVMPALAQTLEQLSQEGVTAEEKLIAYDQLQTSQSIPELMSPLSAREIEIVNCLAEGKTNKEIARNLGTSPHTVRNQVSRLSQKVGARNRTQIVSLTALLQQKKI